MSQIPVAAVHISGSDVAEQIEGATVAAIRKRTSPRPITVPAHAVIRG